MARICDFTGKGTKSGNKRSHSMIASKRTFKPNLIYKWVVLDDGTKIRVKINSKLYKKMRGFI
ncbi:MAG: 50S ribosomal protein L28 [Candidatus Absconditabacterales bacterium]|nr:50S ribosomal protein L28 [Candidatus Absconditabacterales bacterium]